MVSLIRRTYQTYRIEKMKKFYRKKEYLEALNILGTIKFKNKTYFFITKSAILYFIKRYEESIICIDKAFEYIQSEQIYNDNEYSYLKAYLYYLKSLIYKDLNKKELSIKMIREYNLNNQYDINKVRDYLIEDFPFNKIIEG